MWEAVWQKGVESACTLRDNLENDVHTRTLVWDLYARGLFFMYFIALVQLPHQVLGLFGSRGVSPVNLKIKAFKRDFPRYGFFYFPSLFWINSSDTFIMLLPCIGTVCAAIGVCYGFNFYLMLACWAIYRSMICMSTMSFPWDCLLNESGFYGLFLTPKGTIPHPAVAFMLRWVMFRVMIGFGKFKFSDTGPNDKLFIKSFCTCTPIASRIAFYMQRYLPDWAHVAGLLFMFIAEVPASFGFMMGGWIRIVSIITCIILHVLIFFAGHFGFFNVLAPFMCISFFDLGLGVTSINTFHPLLLLLPAHFMALKGTTGVNFLWWYSPALRWLDPLRSIYRVLNPLYIQNSFGVIPPHCLPAERFMVTFEGSMDCRTWKTFEYKTAINPPWIQAPYHPRLEFIQFWSFRRDSIDCTGAADNPYYYSKITQHHRMAQRLLEGNCAFTSTLFRNNPFPTHPPKYVRANVYMYRPVHKGKTNNENPFYDKFFMHEHIPPTTSNPSLFDEWLPTPPQWHFDLYVWRDRYDAEHPDAFKRPDVPRTFWNFIEKYKYKKNISKNGNVDWSAELTSSVANMRKEFSFKQIKDLEAQLGKLTWILYKKQLHNIHKEVEFTTPCTHYSYLGFLAHIIIMRGEKFYKDALEHRLVILDLAREFNFEQGLWLYSHFWFDGMITQARKARFARSIVLKTFNDSITKFLSEYSSYAFIDFVKRQFDPKNSENSENLPSLTENLRNVSDFDWYGNPEYYLRVGERLPLYDYNRKGLILQKLSDKEE